MSAVGTVLLQSPGWNEGKARYETLGTHRQKQNEPRRSGTNRASIGLGQNCAAPTGLNKCVPMINPGLAPWAMKMYRPCRAHLRLPNQLLGYFDARTLLQGYSTLSSPINILYCFNALALVSGGTPAQQEQTAV